MRIVIDSTDRVYRINGTPCREWEGVTAGGTKVLLRVISVDVPAGTKDLREFSDLGILEEMESEIE